MEKKKIWMIVAAAVVAISLIAGVTYAFFSAIVTVADDSQTETQLKSNKLGLIYTGLGEIKYSKMIPGDSFVKTFSVKNDSNHAVSYNIYMDAVTNGFNEDLVYVLEDEDGTVILETALPETNVGRTYLKEAISIDSQETKNYTLTVTYKYKETESQNDYQGAEFKGTLGIDAVNVPNASQTN